MAVESIGSPTRTKVAPWNDPVIRGWVFQVVVVALVGLLAWFLVSNTIENLQRQKIASGFDMLAASSRPCHASAYQVSLEAILIQRPKVFIAVSRLKGSGSGLRTTAVTRA